MPPTRKHICGNSPVMALRLATALVASIVSPVYPSSTISTLE